MASRLDIFNLALTRVKMPLLVSETDGSRQAAACLASFSVQRQALLRRHRWPFAIRRAVLSPVLPAPAFGWAFRMNLPADLNTVIAASPFPDSGRDTLTDAPETYRIEGGALMADAAVMYLLYVADVDEAPRFDSLFTQALAWAIASDLALGLASDRELASFCTEQMERQTLLARRANSIEQPGEVIRTADRLVGGRFGPHWASTHRGF